MSSPRFTAATLEFLRALARNNDREWFRERKAEYELHVRQPMVEFIERLALEIAGASAGLLVGLEDHHAVAHGAETDGGGEATKA